MKEIKFYKVDEPYGYFSNFSNHPIFIKNERWNTVEHYFQANKFNDNDLRKKNQLIESPMKAASEGRKTKNPIREDWNQVKDEIMYEGLKCKFTQYPKLLRNLLDTKDSILIEHTKNDSYWADGGDGKGKNKLGILLMQLRSELDDLVDQEFCILPPWIAFPTIEKYDLFWRMGLGENYLMQWADFCYSSDMGAYEQKFPEPKDWTGFYAED